MKICNKKQEVSSLPDRLTSSQTLRYFLRHIKTTTSKVAFERYQYIFSAETICSTYSMYKAALYYYGSHLINTNLSFMPQFPNSTYK